MDEAGLRLVRFLWCGNDGTVRAKASSAHGLEGRVRSGIGLTVAMQAMNALDQLQPVQGMGRRRRDAIRIKEAPQRDERPVRLDPAIRVHR